MARDVAWLLLGALTIGGRHWCGPGVGIGGRQELLIGCSDGSLLILSTADLDLIQRASQIEGEATMVDMSPDGMHIAMADSERCVGIYRRERNVLESGKEVPWLYLGRYRSHHGAIVGLQFVEDKDAGIIRLLSLAQDRVLVEYDLANSFAATGIVVRSAVSVEQTAVPTALLILPPGAHPGEDPIRPLVVSANNEYKLKILDVLGLSGVHDERPLPSQDSHCVQTVLGPTYGLSALNSLTMLPGSDTDKRYCVYTTPEKVVGMMRLPLDGNPNSCMGLIAHAGPVAGAVISYDGSMVLTTGGSGKLHRSAFGTALLAELHLQPTAGAPKRICHILYDSNGVRPYIPTLLSFAR